MTAYVWHFNHSQEIIFVTWDVCPGIQYWPIVNIWPSDQWSGLGEHSKAPICFWPVNFLAFPAEKFLEPIVWARQFAGKCARHFESSQSEGEHFSPSKMVGHLEISFIIFIYFGSISLHLFWVYFPIFPHFSLEKRWGAAARYIHHFRTIQECGAEAHVNCCSVEGSTRDDSGEELGPMVQWWWETPARWLVGLEHDFYCFHVLE